MTQIIPTEYQEHTKFIQYLNLQGYDYWHTPNQTYTTIKRQKRINMALGVQSGIPDLFVIVGKQLVAVEMKRTKGSTTSDAQRKWIEKLNAAGVPAKVCK